MRSGPRRSYSKEQILGFVGGFVPFLISLLTTVFLTMINFYYCYAISIGALLCFLLFSFGAIQHNRSTHVLIMMVYTIFFELVLIAFTGMFIYYSLEPQRGPFCKVCTQRCLFRMQGTSTPSSGRTSKMTSEDEISLECEGPCGSGVESVVVVCVFALCFAINFFCLIRLWQFRYYLRDLERRALEPPRPSPSVWATIDDIFQFPENSPPPYYNSEEGCDGGVPSAEELSNVKQYYGKLAGLRAPLPTYSEASAIGSSGTSSPPVYEEAVGSPVNSGCSNGSPAPSDLENVTPL